MYGAWGGMVNRCHNPNNSSFARYGALGVTVCDRWRFGEGGKTGFECFLADMGERPEGKTLDRIDGEAGYGPRNCRWATRVEQVRNRRITKFFTVNGKTKPMAEWAEEYGHPSARVYFRVNYLGWPIERALTQPAGKRCR